MNVAGKDPLKSFFFHFLSEGVMDDVKAMIAKNLITKEEVDNLKKLLLNVDPQGQANKFIGWLAKEYVKNKGQDINYESILGEYLALSRAGNTQLNKDIHHYKSVQELSAAVDKANAEYKKSPAGQEKDATVLLDNADFLIVRPNTHAASRKLGMSTFAGRHNLQTGQKDCAWCVTYASPEHFRNYHLNQAKDINFVLVKNPEIIAKLDKAIPAHKGTMDMTAILQSLSSGQLEVWDRTDNRLSDKEAQKYLQICNFS